MAVKQNTLKGEFSLKGKGLHTGKEVCATFKPGEENTGYVIVRTDLEGAPEIPALAKYVEMADRASCLDKEGMARVHAGACHVGALRLRGGQLPHRTGR